LELTDAVTHQHGRFWCHPVSTASKELYPPKPTLSKVMGSSMLKRLVFVTLLLVLLAHHSQAKAERVALVIANAAYADITDPGTSNLKSAVSDARDVGDELKRDGFAVTVGENLSHSAMNSALGSLYAGIKPGDIVLFFFSGYGIQSGRQNYLIPVDAQIWLEQDVRREGFSLTTVIDEINNRGAGAKLVLIDASRSNPYEHRFRNLTGGLAPAVMPKGTLVMYSAAPSAVMADNGENRGLFVQQLLRGMRVPGLSAEEIFNRTRVGVTRASQAGQIPWISSSLADDVFLTPGSASLPPPPVNPAPPAISPVGLPPLPAPSPVPQEATALPPPPLPPIVLPAPPLPRDDTPPNFALPDFPWPPPAASTSYVLPDNLLSGYHRLGEVEHAIEQALERTGYVERAFFRTPSGIAMVTRLERIQADGTSMTNDRWPISPTRYELQAGLMTFLQGLFFVPPGHYRLIVFIMQDKPFNQSDKVLSKDEARGLMSKGANILPQEIAQQSFDGGHCTVLIYEFASDSSSVRLIDSPLTGREHLEKSGVLAAIGEHN
jgi:hypothetical protein